jgi:hypothetical protein
VRPFKGIFCDDISEFESYHLSQPVRSLRRGFQVWENRRPSRAARGRVRGLGRLLLHEPSTEPDVVDAFPGLDDCSEQSSSTLSATVPGCCR